MWGDKHFRKNSVIKGDRSNFLKSRGFFLNIIVFHFIIRKGKVHVSKTSETLKYFALATYFTALHILLLFYFTVLSVLDKILFYV